MPERIRQHEPERCRECEYWKYLSATTGTGWKSCHCLLETGKRHGRHGDSCSTRVPRKGKRGKRPSWGWDGL